MFKWGILRRAVEAGKVSYQLVDPREFTADKHKSIDDVAYGGRPVLTDDYAPAETLSLVFRYGQSGSSCTTIWPVSFR